MIGQEKFYAWWDTLLTDSPVHRVSEVDAQVIWQAARAEVDMLKAQIAEYDGLMEDVQVFQAEIARLHKSIASLQNLLNHQHANDEAANRMLSDACARMEEQLNSTHQTVHIDPNGVEISLIKDLPSGTVVLTEPQLTISTMRFALKELQRTHGDLHAVHDGRLSVEVDYGDETDRPAPL